MTRMKPLRDADWPEAVADLRAGFAGRLNVYRVMAHHPDLLRAFAGLRGHVVQNTALGPERAEVVILRLAHRLGSGYEWAHHVVRGRRAGLSDARIRSLRGDADTMAAPDAALARAVDALVDHHRLSDAQAQAVAALGGDKAVLDLIATVGMYLTLGFIVESFATPVDDDIAAELARAPLARAPLA